MPAITRIIEHLDGVLDAPAFADFGPNGLQVPGSEDVTKVVCGVSAHAELIERAAAAGAELLLVHHGILWDFHPRRIDRALARRLKLLLVGGINLVQYHLPLDAHPVHGNNALLAEALGCSEHRAFAPVKGRDIGRVGRFGAPEGLPAEELFARVESVCERPPLVFPYGSEAVRTIGIVSGAAAKSLPDAVAAGCDAFLTGEPAEHVMADAKEAGIHFIAAGHHATERFGVRALGRLLAEEFGVEQEFIEIPNPV